MRKSIFVLGVIIYCGCAIVSDFETIQDTRQNRIAAAEHYLKIVRPANFLKDAVANITLELPEDRREELKNLIMKEVNLEVVETVIKTTLVKHFTAAEIEALADFYNRPEGQSIMYKFAGYAAEVMPPIEEEVLRVLSLAGFAKTQLEWSTPKQVFIAGMDDEKIVAEYVFTNSGPYSVALKSVKTSCGCVTASANKKVFQPSESGKVTVIFNIGDRVGTYIEAITVVTDEPEEPAVMLELKVEIPELLNITPRFLFWEADENIHPKEINLSSPKEYNVQILGVESVPELFDVKLVRDDINERDLLHVAPKPTPYPVNGKMFITTVIGSSTIRRFPVFLRILPADTGKIDNADISSWSDVLWIDTGSRTEYNKSHIPGAIILNEDEWNSQIESVINQWTPRARIVVYCHHGCRSYQIAQRLREYGLKNIYIIVLGG
jgi:rhodanese-related sulfurtransferase